MVQDINSLSSQIGYSVASNNRSLHPFKFYITNFGGKLEHQLKKQDGFPKWKLTCDTRHYSEIFDKSKLVYLSSEAQEVMQNIDPGN